MTLEQFCSKIRSAVADAGLAAWVTAEVAQVGQSHGHLYISLVQKSESSDAPVASLRCTIWASSAHKVLTPFRAATGGDLQAGMKILAFVGVGFHPVYGLSGQISAIDPAYTLGDLEARRRAIWEQLVSEGVADMNKGLRLPLVVKDIAVVSAAGAAGYGDFCDQLDGNGFGVAFRTQLFAARMQGAGAEAEIVAALDAVARRSDEFDVVVIIRGGGSRLDLACFDSYAIANNIAQFPLPVITGIGHERDRSIADMVAHTAVKTPTAVAEFIIARAADFLLRLDDLRSQTVAAAHGHMASAHAETDMLVARLLGAEALRLAEARNRVTALTYRALGSAERRMGEQGQRVEMLRHRLIAAAENKIDAGRRNLDALRKQVEAVDPRAVMRRGFSVTTDTKGQRLTSIADVAMGDAIVTHFADGSVTSTVNRDSQQT